MSLNFKRLTVLLKASLNPLCPFPAFAGILMKKRPQIYAFWTFKKWKGKNAGSASNSWNVNFNNGNSNNNNQTNTFRVRCVAP